MPSVNTLTRNLASIRVIDESVDSPSMSSIVGSQATRSIWADAVAATITVGGGAANTSTLVRAAAAGTVNVGENTVVQTVNVGSSNTTSTTAVRSGSGGLTVTANGATLGMVATGANAITFTTNAVARSRVTSDGAQNWVGITTGSAPAVSAAAESRFYYNSTLDQVLLSTNGGAYTALSTGEAPGTFTNQEGTSLLQGELVYQTAAATRSVLRSSAAANTIAARTLGVVVPATIASTATGQIAADTLVSVRLQGSLTPALGDEVFLSATVAGRGTNVAPSTSGQLVVPLGYITDLMSYDGGANLLVQMQFVRGPRVQV